MTEEPIYHRKESDSQTVDDAKKQIASQEIWGGPARNCFFSDIPKVKAFSKKFDRTTERGIEFTTSVEPDRGTRPGLVYWSGEREGVRNEDDWAKIKVQIKFCNQLEEIWIADE
ncbi:hypothetical protein [Chamaesiphon sp. GL140_3_metabinner_50]|uniref:hypothetical protein n=1 Tax=Chamaesiphon sp. GL140_3_metabinner_50 TaxID=2970812 RepID=UPI0025E17BC4|nr:hypothetical protein [Chamaesiphon sp. GL140_3_metabinner_50]